MMLGCTSPPVPSISDYSRWMHTGQVSQWDRCITGAASRQDLLDACDPRRHCRQSSYRAWQSRLATVCTFRAKLSGLASREAFPGSRLEPTMMGPWLAYVLLPSLGRLDNITEEYRRSIDCEIRLDRVPKGKPFARMQDSSICASEQCQCS